MSDHDFCVGGNRFLCFSPHQANRNDEERQRTSALSAELEAYRRRFGKPPDDG